MGGDVEEYYLFGFRILTKHTKGLTSHQLSEWEAYDRLDPIGAWRDDFRMSYIASLLTNLVIRVHGKKGAKLTDVKDFLLDWSGDMKHTQQQTPQEMREFLLQFAKTQNKKVESQKKSVPKRRKQ